MTQVSETQPPQHFARDGQGLLLPLPGQTQRQSRVLLDGEFRKKFAVLEHEAEPFATQRAEFLVVELTKGSPFKANLAPRYRQDSGQAVQQRGFAGATLTGNGCHLTAT